MPPNVETRDTALYTFTTPIEIPIPDGLRVLQLSQRWQLLPGELTGLSGFTGTKEVTLKNGYVSSCPKVQTLVDIYDGPRTSQTGLGSS